MTFESFVYLIEPVWYIYLGAIIATILNYLLFHFVLNNSLAIRSFPALKKKAIWAICLIASWFIILPFSLLYSLLDKQSPSDVLASALTNYFEITGKPFLWLGDHLFPYGTSSMAPGLFIGTVWLTVAFAPVLIVLFILASLMLRNFTLKQKLVLLFITCGLGALSSIFIAFTSYTAYNQSEDYAYSCVRKIGETIQFHPHVKDLCDNRPTFSECPKTENELRAFNPEKYDLAETCTDFKYYFSETQGQLWLQKKNLITYIVLSKNKKAAGREKYNYYLWELPWVKQQYAK